MPDTSYALHKFYILLAAHCLCLRFSMSLCTILIAWYACSEPKHSLILIIACFNAKLLALKLASCVHDQFFLMQNIILSIIQTLPIYPWTEKAWEYQNFFHIILQQKKNLWPLRDFDRDFCVFVRVWAWGNLMPWPRMAFSTSHWYYKFM